MKYFAFKAQAQGELSDEIRLEPETMSSSLTSIIGTPDHTPPVVYPQAESAGGRQGPDGNQSILDAKILLQAHLQDGSESVEFTSKSRAPQQTLNLKAWRN